MTLKITIKHAPIQNDPNEWIADFAADGPIPKMNAFSGPTFDSIVEALPVLVKRFINQPRP